MDSGSKYESLEIEQEGREEGTDPKAQNDKGDLESMKPNHPRSIGVKMVAIFIYILGILSFTLMSVHCELIGLTLILITVTCKMGYYYNANLDAFDYMLVRSIAMIVCTCIILYL